MKSSGAERFSIALFITAVSASALTMLWLLWHFPVVTTTTALFVLAGVALMGSLAKTLDAGGVPDAPDSSPTA